MRGYVVDEVDSGTLDRVTSRAGMTGLLAAKWSYLTLLGVLQITVMFTYGALVYRLPFLRHLGVRGDDAGERRGGRGLWPAAPRTACRTRAQLGTPTIVILTISALGGSMFPRFHEPGDAEDGTRSRLNTWALDG